MATQSRASRPWPRRPHNEGPSAVWSSGHAAYDEVSRGILDAIEHAINRLEPTQQMRIHDLATGTGWTARRLAERGYDVTGTDFAPDTLTAALALAGARQLDIPFVDGDTEALPFENTAFRCSCLHVWRHVYAAARGRRERNGACCGPRGQARTDGLDTGRQRLRDVQGDTAVHAKA